MTNQESEKTYSSGEAAKKLGISVQSLKRRRLLGDIEGTRVGTTNVYIYTEKQLREARLSSKKPGPKDTRKKGDEPLKNIGDTHVFHRAPSLARVS